MLPENSLSLTPVEDSPTLPIRSSELEDFCFDPKTGVMTRVFYDGNNVLQQKGEYALVSLLNSAGLISLGYAIDKNDLPMLAYTKYGVSYLQFRDIETRALRNITLGPTVKQPRLAREKILNVGVQDHDVILSYIKDGFLYTRAHSEHFAVEKQQAPAENLWQSVLMKNRRIGFYTY